MIHPVQNRALILVGFQNEYFSPEGLLFGVLQESTARNLVLTNTLSILEAVGSRFGVIVNTPIVFTADYSELKKPVGILKKIQELGAFKRGQNGSKTIDALSPFQRIIIEVEGKRGLNAFSNTRLEPLLRNHDITEVVLAGTLTSICIDSTGRSAAERGFAVTILSDCTSSESQFEQDFFCTEVFPMYARVIDHDTLLAEVAAAPNSRAST